ncbi:GAF domain-containing protein [Undibacterium sp. Ji67W]|uniref:GAF domain-containing protein n=1 Tax=Undibacterium sp. Ji67W TaxID=3413042 RepID=UPI003BF043D2
MLIHQYLSQSQIQIQDLPSDFSKLFAEYQSQITNLTQAPPENIKWQYQVPELGEGGSCSIFDQLAADPYDLTLTLGGRTTANTQMLSQLQSIVDFYQLHSSSQWFGIYQKRLNQQGETVLVKLAYFGAASRAEFPLTAEFATMSNNSTVGMTGKARIINDVSAYLTAGGEYYTCDPKVQSEACLPLLGTDGSVVGIIDSEAFAKNVFVGKELALLLSVVMALPPILR